MKTQKLLNSSEAVALVCINYHESRKIILKLFLMLASIAENSTLFIMRLINFLQALLNFLVLSTLEDLYLTSKAERDKTRGSLMRSWIQKTRTGKFVQMPSARQGRWISIR